MVKLNDMVAFKVFGCFTTHTHSGFIADYPVMVGLGRAYPFLKCPDNGIVAHVHTIRFDRTCLYEKWDLLLFCSCRANTMQGFDVVVIASEKQAGLGHSKTGCISIIGDYTACRPPVVSVLFRLCNFF
jgi:hypothetical protein